MYSILLFIDDCKQAIYRRRLAPVYLYSRTHLYIGHTDTVLVHTNNRSTPEKPCTSKNTLHICLTKSLTVNFICYNIHRPSYCFEFESEIKMEQLHTLFHFSLNIIKISITIFISITFHFNLLDTNQNLDQHKLFFHLPLYTQHRLLIISIAFKAHIFHINPIMSVYVKLMVIQTHFTLCTIIIFIIQFNLFVLRLMEGQ